MFRSIIKKKIIVGSFCLGVGMNQLLLEYKDYYYIAIYYSNKVLPYQFKSKLFNNKYISIAKSSKNKNIKLKK